MISGFWTAPIWFAWKWDHFLARHLEMRCLAETIGPGKLLSQVLWSQITHLKRQETRQWAWRDCECLRYVTNMHTHTDTHSHTFLKLCSPSRRNVRTRSRTVLPTSDRKRQDRWQRWTDNSTCFPSQTNFLLCLGRRWGQTSRRIGGQGDKRIWQQSSIQSRLRGCQAYLYTIKSLKTWRLLTAAEEETRGFLRSVEELAHKQRL